MNGGAEKQAPHRLPDDPGTGAEKQQRLEERRQILDLSVAVGVPGVGRSARNTHRPQCDQGCGQVEARVHRLGDDTQATGPQADHDLGASQKQRSQNGIECHRPLVAVGSGERERVSVLVMVMAGHVSQ